MPSGPPLRPPLTSGVEFPYLFDAPWSALLLSSLPISLLPVFSWCKNPFSLCVGLGHCPLPLPCDRVHSLLRGREPLLLIQPIVHLCVCARARGHARLNGF